MKGVSSTIKKCFYNELLPTETISEEPMFIASRMAIKRGGKQRGKGRGLMEEGGCRKAERRLGGQQATDARPSRGSA